MKKLTFEEWAYLELKKAFPSAKEITPENCLNYASNLGCAYRSLRFVWDAAQENK